MVNFRKDFGPPTATKGTVVLEVPHVKPIRNQSHIYYYRPDGVSLRECIITASGAQVTVDAMRRKGFLPIGEMSSPEEIERIYDELEARRPEILAGLQEKIDTVKEYLTHPMPRDEWALYARIQGDLERTYKRVETERLTKKDFQDISTAMRQNSLARRNQLAAILRGLSMDDMAFIMKSAIEGLGMELTTKTPVVTETAETVTLTKEEYEALRAQSEAEAARRKAIGERLKAGKAAKKASA